MAVLLKCGAVFLHVPKTGGSWITHVLTENGLVRRQIGHIHADMVRIQYYSSGGRVVFSSAYQWLKSITPRKLKGNAAGQLVKRAHTSYHDSRKPFCFCFVRHPLDWYASWWRYMCGRSGYNWSTESDLTSWHPCRELNNLGAPRFERFVRNVLEAHPGFVTGLFGLYTGPGIDFIGKQENLADDLIAVLTRLNVNFDEDRVRSSEPLNVSKVPSQSTHWPATVRTTAEQLEYAGLVRYGYEAHPDHLARHKNSDGKTDCQQDPSLSVE